MDEALVYGVLILTLALLVSGKLRYDLVALGALLILTIAGIVPASEAYLGFAHPAVVTVAAVLILSRALQSSGVIDVMGSWYSRIGRSLTAQITSLSGLVAVLSGFMNLSLLMPLAIRVAKRKSPLFPLPDAAGLLIAAGRHDHLDRDASQHNNLGLSTRYDRRRLQNVRLHSGRVGSRSMRRDIHLVGWLASHTEA